MVITDRYDHLVDDKGRLAIPSQIRNAMDPQEDGTGFYLLPETRYLQLIPEKLFKRLAAQATAGLALPADAAKARRVVFGNTSYVEPDKQGRVIIPERFLADGKVQDPFSPPRLGREVTLLGAGDRVELWNRSQLDAHLNELGQDRGSLANAMQQMFTAPAPPAETPTATGPA
jgi:MraZ protein